MRSKCSRLLFPLGSWLPQAISGDDPWVQDCSIRSHQPRVQRSALPLENQQIGPWSVMSTFHRTKSKLSHCLYHMCFPWKEKDSSSFSKAIPGFLCGVVQPWHPLQRCVCVSMCVHVRVSFWDFEPHIEMAQTFGLAPAHRADPGFCQLRQ